ncbi:unnamed protein product [Allacma fusca]|uniref:Uncharacterized protein n=1 Tax=Allacma fusca TaxID=39272 RepID=A0A8J2NX27_9HEXA|nr:unnamed protein product [Allacma fusca]
MTRIQSAQFLVIGVMVLFLSLANGNIPCKLLKWEPASSERTVPGDALALGGVVSKSYIIRANVSGSFVIGTTVKSDDEGRDDAYVPSIEDGNSTFLASYDILTVPEGCQLVWKYVGDQPPDFRAESSSSPTRYFGRVMKEGTYYAGEIDYSTKPPVITVAFPDETEEVDSEDTDIYVLTSFSPGLKVTLTDVNIPADNNPGAGQVLSSEEVRNYADVTISQTFKHSTSITSTVSTTISSKYTTNSVVTAGIDLTVASYEYKQEKSYTKETTEVWTTTTTTEVSVTRTITVPPYSVIQACSVVSLETGFCKDYNATAVYTAPGLEPEEIMSILLQDENPLDVKIDKNKRVVVENIQGSFKGNFVLDSVFYVFDLAYGDVDCTDEDKKMRKNLALKNANFILDSCDVYY